MKMVSRPSRVVLLGLVSAGIFAQPALQLKPRRIAGDQFARDRASARSVSGERRHWLVQFAAEPTNGDAEALRIRGARVVAPAPEWGFVVSAEPDLDLSGLNVARAEPLRVSDKLSPELTSSSQSFGERAVRTGRRRDTTDALVEFHPDVAPASARRILSLSGLRVLDHPQLLDQHYIVEGDYAQIEQLAEWDEVSYIFPASHDLENSTPVHVCYGAVTETGPVGQSIALVGPGWAPGKGSARLSYALGALTQKLGSDQLKQEIQRALGEWSKYVQIDFNESRLLTAPRTLAFRWGRGVGGGPIPFDGPGKMLAYTYFPAPPNPEPIAGDLYFDDDENWQVGADIDVFSVVLHELGHALGLGHSDKPGAVMYPYYRRASGLTEEDIGAARELYGTRNGESPDPSTPTTPPTTGAPSDPPAGDPPTQDPPTQNPSDPPSTPAPNPPGDRTPPQIAINSPSSATVTTSQAAIAVSGSSSDAGGVAQVRWANATGAAGIATGTTRWRAAVPLVKGINAITIQAIDTAGNTSWRSVIITRR